MSAAGAAGAKNGQTFSTLNGQTVTIVHGADGVVTVRVAKDGHNRAIAKLSADAAAVIADALTGGAHHG